jgi:hypothetical protein
MDAIDRADRAVTKISAKSAVLSRLFIVMSESKFDFCGEHEEEFWEGLYTAMNEIDAAAREAGAGAATLFEALKGGAK